MEDQKKNDEREQLLDSTDVAKQLKKSRSWVYENAMSGVLPARRVGNSWRFKQEDLDRYLDSVRVQPTPSPTNIFRRGR